LRHRSLRPPRIQVSSTFPGCIVLTESDHSYERPTPYSGSRPVWSVRICRGPGLCRRPDLGSTPD